MKPVQTESGEGLSGMERRICDRCTAKRKDIRRRHGQARREAAII